MVSTVAPSNVRVFAKLKFYGLADQVVLSGSNFLTMLLIGRTLAPSQFGVFTLALTTLLVANTAQAALVVQPHSVIGSARDGESFRNYTASTVLLQVGLLTALTPLLILVSLVAPVSGLSGPTLIPAVGALWAWQLQELARRVQYAAGQTRAAFINDSLAYGLQPLAIALLAVTGALTAQTALVAIGATSAFAVVVVVGTAKFAGGVPHLTEVGANLRFGSWLLAGQVAYVIGTQSYMYLAASMGTPAAAAQLRVALLLLGPLNILLFYLGTSIPPALSRQRHNEGVRRGLLASYVSVIPLYVSYLGAVVLLAPVFLGLLFGDQYKAAGGAVLWLGGYYLLALHIQIITVGFQVAREPRAIFLAYIPAALTTVAFGRSLVDLDPIAGPAAGMALSAAIVLAVLVLLARFSEKRRADLSATGSPG